jgi:deazaflavin-dependent oxidoreductase (nitroreductase family)
MTPLDHPPSPVVKLLARLPLRLYDLHMGRLLGHRFLVLTHRGRRSGRSYRTMLEVVSWSPSRHEATVAAGWGEHANWYQNIRAAPAQEILIANERFVPEQRFLDVEERIKVLRAYRQSHPIAMKALGGLLGLKDGDDPQGAARRLPMIAFQPKNGQPYRH